MLDLNLSSDYLDIPITGDDHGISLHNLLEASGLQMESSGSFNSSSLNAGGDEDDSSNLNAEPPCGYSFSILANNQNETAVVADSDRNSDHRTIQLFPSDGQSSDSIMRQWLDLGCREQQRPQIRKSRRGPRSRSSQYRGVTFYRRTGRWESHIWLVISSISFLLLICFRYHTLIFVSNSGFGVLLLLQGLWKTSVLG